MIETADGVLQKVVVSFSFIFTYQRHFHNLGGPVFEVLRFRSIRFRSVLRERENFETEIKIRKLLVYYM